MSRINTPGWVPDTELRKEGMEGLSLETKYLRTTTGEGTACETLHHLHRLCSIVFTQLSCSAKELEVFHLKKFKERLSSFDTKDSYLQEQQQLPKIHLSSSIWYRITDLKSDSVISKWTYLQLSFWTEELPYEIQSGELLVNSLAGKSILRTISTWLQNNSINFTSLPHTWHKATISFYSNQNIWNEGN